MDEKAVFTLYIDTKYIYMKTTLLLSLLFCSSTIFAQQTDTLQPNENTGKDAWVWSFFTERNQNFGEANGSNSGLNNVLRAETWKWDPSNFDTIRGLIYFDLSYLPQDAQIVSAHLDLFFFRNTNFTPQTGENAALLENITEAWVENSVTWNNQPATDSTLRVFLPKSTSTTQDYMNIDVTNLTKAQLQNNFYGWMLKLQTETGFNGLTFASSENTNASLRPRLRITYTSTNSINDVIEKQRVNVYPNPTKEVLIVEQAKGYTINSITLKEMTGKTVFTQTYNDAQSQYAITIKNLSPGTYMLSINNGELVQKINIEN